MQLVPFGSSLALNAWLDLLIIGLLVGLVSRLWFTRWLLGGLLFPLGGWAPKLMQVLRTPGNITHEGGHAVGFLVAGYRVTSIGFWFTDPQERGYCQAGAPWAPWASSFLARLIASPAPLFAGALMLKLSAYWLHVPTFMLSQLGKAQLMAWERLPFSALFNALVVWWSEPVGILQGVAFLLLVLSFSLDLAPSKEDLRSLSVPALMVTVLLSVAPILDRWQGGFRELYRPIDLFLTRGLIWIAEPLWWSLALLIACGLVLTPIRLFLSGHR